MEREKKGVVILSGVLTGRGHSFLFSLKPSRFRRASYSLSLFPNFVHTYLSLFHLLGDEEESKKMKRKEVKITVPLQFPPVQD